MKEIFKVFKRDLTRIKKSKMAIVILIGMIFIPGIYAWLNIDSNWDPYDNTGNIPIAIVNKDEGVDLLRENINIGDSLTEKLKSNSTMKWVFTDEDDARKKVESGEYYGAILIPENFSNKITTIFDSTEISRPTFDFIVNDKKNPIAPIITNKAVDTLETTLDQAIVNAAVYKAADKAEELNIEEKGTATITKVTMRLSEAKQGIEKLRATLNTISAASSSTASALSAVKNLLPTNIDTINAAGNLQEVQRQTSSLNNLNSRINDNITTIFNAAEKVSSTIENEVNSIDINDTHAREKAEKAIALIDALNTILSKEQEVIVSLQNLAGANMLSDLQDKLTNNIQKNLELRALLQSVAEGNTPILDKAKTKAYELHSSINDANTHYQNITAPTVKKAIDHASSAISSVIGSLSYVDSAFTKSDIALGNTIDALNSMSSMNANIDTLLADLENDLGKIATTIGGATESDLFLKIVNLLQNTPEDIAKFISEPIATEKTELYKIDHYGSKMAPFYTILATWVGCTLLVAILKTDIEDDESRIKPYQAYFGRFLLFASIAVCQGLVIGLGDIVLGVQILNMPLFLFTIMLSSLVFMLIIYSLAISFGKIGEAVAVVIMVAQVAGSGGTFPIELLPSFFQRLQPFMPFYPSMTAVRETIGGFYGSTYTIALLLLLCHTIIPLLLGLVIRRPIIELKHNISKDIEKTDVII